MTRFLVPVVLAALAAAAAFAWNPPRSEHYRMDRTVLLGGAGNPSSATYAVEVDVAQSCIEGATSTCNSGYQLSLGDWPGTGVPRVPVLLEVRKGPGREPPVELHWSGTAPQFRVFRSPEPRDVAAPGNRLVDVPSCSYTDEGAAGTILYYLVAELRD